MRTEVTSVCGLKVPVYVALRYLTKDRLSLVHDKPATYGPKSPVAGDVK
jgi:hypothetical protein